LNVIFALDAPHYHHVRIGERNVFRGVALAVGDSAVASVTIRGVKTRVDGASPELAFLPYPHSDACRFSIEIDVPDDTPFEIRAQLESGEEVLVFLYDASLARALSMNFVNCVESLPAPSPELIAATQGLGNVESYRDSSVSGLLTLKTLIARDVDSVLDIGCGT